MTECLIDTDILSYFFKGDPTVTGKFADYLTHYDQINFTIITYYEILGGLKSKKAQKQIRSFEEFVLLNNLIPLSEDAARIASDIYADLRGHGITIGSSDILVAGIALEHGLALVTNNEKHFSTVGGLEVQNWRKQ